MPAFAAALHAVRRFWAVVICSAVLCLTSAPALAQDSSLYIVSGVEVDVTDTDASKAKLKAISEAQIKAFRILVERLGEPGDVAKVQHFKPAEIGRLMSSLSVEEERTGPKRYIGKLTIKFLPDRVRKALSKVKFNVVEEQAPRILVIPLWRTEQGPVVWEDNPWRAAWQSLKSENSVVPVLIPLGDISDAQSLTAEEVLAADQAKLEAIGYRYEARAVLVALAEPVGDNSVRATMQGKSPVGDISFDKTYVSADGGLADASLQAASRFHKAMIFKWKKSRPPQGLANTNVQVVNIAVPFSSLNEWNAIRGQLSIAPGVTAVEVNSLASTGASVRLTYNIAFEQLRLALQQQRLNLVLVGGTWIVQPF
ncbi:MAG: DUF2066 domain-containing protein [Rhizobiales bacterium]|nr:DUF2066 domain-containing protein [Hyphomicrobiales bacterium]